MWKEDSTFGPLDVGNLLKKPLSVQKFQGTIVIPFQAQPPEFL
jgi:hypothetical protein